MQVHFATLWESMADAIGDGDAVICGDSRLTWSEYDDRAARLASALRDAGLKPDSKVGLYLYNGNEYLEAHYAAFKQRAVPININYRYLDDELLYLLDNSDAEVLVFHTSLGERVAHVMERAPKVKLWIEVDDGGDSIPGAVPYETLIKANEPAARIQRSETDAYMIYTGGTTGMPKGVVYEIGSMLQFFIRIGVQFSGIDGLPEAHQLAGIAKALRQSGNAHVSIPACPLMHGTGIWLGVIVPQCAGATIVTLEGRSFNPHELWQTVEREMASQVVIVGDAMAKPMIRALEKARDEDRQYDLSCLKLMVSSGVMWTSEVKKQLLEWHDFTLIDAMGSTEGGIGTQITTRGNVGETARFPMNPTTKVFTEDGREVKPGSGETGMIATGGAIPICYYKDEAKSKNTFKTIDGVRYAFAGDWATIEADGTLTLLGRGSNCINTAGEKVYPEEVEEAVKKHPDVIDCLVVGVPDEKFGERVTGVASLREGSTADASALREFTRTKLAAFKVPKQLVVVERVHRAPNGKADYPWARNVIEEST
jgi:fatty-acyl-CoA synthase